MHAYTTSSVFVTERMEGGVDASGVEKSPFSDRRIRSGMGGLLLPFRSFWEMEISTCDEADYVDGGGTAWHGWFALGVWGSATVAPGEGQLPGKRLYTIIYARYPLLCQRRY